ncbi:30S ribosomal protein S9 [Candidatus Gracilibacteria bacterium]|nr:30S ribosomal protein S9 [Candidatus Gracilibacteria bacterium]
MKEVKEVVAVKAAPAKKVSAPTTAKGPIRPYFYANGKRKTSIATVRLYKDGNGTITVNDRTFENYFPVFTDQDKIVTPLRITDTMKSFDISAHVQGGGVHSQAEAIRHAISKALLVYNVSMRPGLKSAGLLTRDPRIKERKKYGLHRARRAPQFSKR